MERLCWPEPWPTSPKPPSSIFLHLLWHQSGMAKLRSWWVCSLHHLFSIKYLVFALANGSVPIPFSSIEASTWSFCSKQWVCAWLKSQASLDIICWQAALQWFSKTDSVSPQVRLLFSTAAEFQPAIIFIGMHSSFAIRFVQMRKTAVCVNAHHLACGIMFMESSRSNCHLEYASCIQELLGDHSRGKAVHLKGWWGLPCRWNWQYPLRAILSWAWGQQTAQDTVSGWVWRSESSKWQDCCHRGH